MIDPREVVRDADLADLRDAEARREAPVARPREDAVGVEQVLDQLVEVWLSLAARMQEKGNHVRLVAYVKQEDGMGIEFVGLEDRSKALIDHIVQKRLKKCA